MTASAGDLVTPGNPVNVPAGMGLGSGLHETESGVVALVSGKLIEIGRAHV